MTTFIYHGNINKFMHQNGASFTGDYFPGVLLDNFILDCKRGYAAVYEKCVNCWSSEYLIKFVPFNKLYEIDQLFSEFITAQENCEKQMEEENKKYLEMQTA